MGPVRGPVLLDLVGRRPIDVVARLGEADVRRRVGDDLWLLYELEGLSLRVRCRPTTTEGQAPMTGPPATGSTPPTTGPRVASWTARFREGRVTLREATEPFGLWPSCAPDVDAASRGPCLLRRALPAGTRRHSFTARVRAGRIDQIAAFDEEPEWPDGIDEAQPPPRRAGG